MRQHIRIAHSEQTDKFHPLNSALRKRSRIERMSDGSIEAWIAHGIMAVAAYRNSGETFRVWKTHKGRRFAHDILLFEWCELKLKQLEGERARRINYHRRTLNGPKATKITPDFGLYRVFVDEYAPIREACYTGLDRDPSSDAEVQAGQSPRRA